MRLQRAVIIGLLRSVLSNSVVALRFELSAPWLSAEDGQPALDYRVVVSSSYGNRTHLFALKGRNPKPIDERAVSARTVGREALESSSAAFQTAARQSQLPTRFAFRHEKSPMSL